MQVQVTQEDIDLGWRHSARKCPVALALGRKGVLTGIVQGNWAEVKFRVYRLSLVGRQWISAFDCGEKVQPTTIRLYPPR